MRGGRRPFAMPALAGLLFALACLAGLLASAALYRFAGWPAPEALAVARWAVYGAGPAFLLALLGLVLARPGSGRRGAVAALAGLLLSGALIAMGAHWEWAATAYPRINDISTDLDEPPVFWAMPNPTDHPGGETARLQREAYPDIAPLVLPLSPEAVFAAARALVAGRGWEIVAEDAADGRIEAVAASPLYGFKDEIVLRLAPAGAGTRLDMRSRSRTGRIDRGVNAKRIRAFLVEMKARVG